MARLPPTGHGAGKRNGLCSQGTALRQPDTSGRSFEGLPVPSGLCPTGTMPADHFISAGTELGARAAHTAVPQLLQQPLPPSQMTHQASAASLLGLG